MVSLHQVEEQLKQIGCNYRMWGRAEIRELSNVLMPEEKIVQCANGTYEGGFALLCITNYRVLLIDRKPMLLTIEDIRYDMIAEVDYHTRFVMATVRIFTPMRNLVFNSWSHTALRKCTNAIQQHVMELRQHGLGQGLRQAAQQNAGQFDPTRQPQQVAPAAVGPPQSGYKPAMNPYTKLPMLSRRRRFPSFY